MNSPAVSPYNRQAAVNYANTWSMKRNPAYGDFTGIGGDCTNFISQCLVAGGAIMNTSYPLGWFYHSMSYRSPSWSGVPFLYNFLTKNSGPGPIGELVPLHQLQLGDIVQLGKLSGHYYHTLIVVDLQKPISYQSVLISTHTVDVDHRRLSDYDFEQARFIHIHGIKK